jgi:hypothetical protein
VKLFTVPGQVMHKSTRKVVLETFRELLCLLYRDIDTRYDFGAKFAISEDEFLKGVMGNFRGGTPA